MLVFLFKTVEETRKSQPAEAEKRRVRQVLASTPKLDPETLVLEFYKSRLGPKVKNWQDLALADGAQAYLAVMDYLLNTLMAEYKTTKPSYYNSIELVQRSIYDANYASIILGKHEPKLERPSWWEWWPTTKRSEGIPSIRYEFKNIELQFKSAELRRLVISFDILKTHYVGKEKISDPMERIEYDVTDRRITAVPVIEDPDKDNIIVSKYVLMPSAYYEIISHRAPAPISDADIFPKNEERLFGYGLSFLIYRHYSEKDDEETNFEKSAWKEYSESVKRIAVTGNDVTEAIGKYAGNEYLNKKYSSMSLSGSTTSAGRMTPCNIYLFSNLVPSVQIPKKELVPISSQPKTIKPKSKPQKIDYQFIAVRNPMGLVDIHFTLPKAGLLSINMKSAGSGSSQIVLKEKQLPSGQNNLSLPLPTTWEQEGMNLELLVDGKVVATVTEKK